MVWLTNLLVIFWLDMSQLINHYLSNDVDDSHRRAPPRAQDVSNQEVDPAGLDVATLADPDGAKNCHEDESHSTEDDEGSLLNPGLGHDPTGAEEDDDSEDVDETGGEDTVPGAEQHPFRDQEMREPPGRGTGTLQTEIEIQLES